MSTNSHQSIIDQYLSVRNLNKTAFLQGWVNEDEFTRVQQDTFWKYTEQLVNAGIWDRPQAMIMLLQAEDKSWEVQEYGYMGRGEN